MVESRVLSIQSHVVHGYVGNKAAVLPLQILGLEVDFINSVQFSNHTGYPKFTGERLGGDALGELVSGLRANGLIGYTHVLTGYIGAASFLRAVIATVKAVREAQPSAVYVCDPVLGDGGRLYVPEELVDIYREEVLPLASVLTPNHFEAELLTRSTIATEDDAFRACAALHARGVRTIVITSAVLRADGANGGANGGADGGKGGGDGGSGDGEGGRVITLLASQRSAGAPADTRYRIEIPAIRGAYTGTGDLTAALILAWMHKLRGGGGGRESGSVDGGGVRGIGGDGGGASGADDDEGDDDLATALERAVASVQAVLRRTHDETGPGSELRLVQSIGELASPTVTLRAQRVS
ncbi:hypothetical protein KFE25_002249 [Diacronema lutheri]|uniref:pyridoxal kinase n=1 Tax=Diacronema lutheri TaxID=2081491 RepID=A0A8J6CGA0_DIALT|nr:hypothetical protein KFE25_002249 [Diacronema lutheri]